MTFKKAIVVGASSGIGRALAVVLAREGYEVGLVARRENLLRELAAEIPSKTYIKVIDVRQSEKALFLLEELIGEMGGLDLMVANAGVNPLNPDLDWKVDFETIQVNVLGFAAACHAAIKHFLKAKSGHLVGISSIAAVRGSGRLPAYGASKAFMVNYLAGLRQRLGPSGIFVTDIRPGWVATDMARGRKGVFWAAAPAIAAEQMYEAIGRKKKTVYVTKRWWFVAQLLRRIPDWLYDWGYRRIEK